MDRSVSVATNIGDWDTATVEGKEFVAIAIRYESKARGALRCWLVLAKKVCIPQIVAKFLKEELNKILTDKTLVNLISSLGHQISGYKYTQGTVAEGMDDERILENRKKLLEEDLGKLINHIKDNY